MSHSLSCFPQTFGCDTENELQAPAADDSAPIEEVYMAVKETNHGGSRKTNKRWTGASSDLALPVNLAVHFQCKLRGEYKKVFSCSACVTLQRSWKWQSTEKKEAAEAAWSDREWYPLGSCRGSIPRATSLGTITCVIPGSRCNTSCKRRWAGSRWLFQVHQNIFTLTVGSPETKSFCES